jgi:predicted patatin/cPLA2 family phospholipase
MTESDELTMYNNWNILVANIKNQKKEWNDTFQEVLKFVEENGRLPWESFDDNLEQTKEFMNKNKRKPRSQSQWDESLEETKEFIDNNKRKPI